MGDRSAALLEFDVSMAGGVAMPLCGVDEVGRGCLAGPVVAAAVVLPSGAVLPGLDDSKRLGPRERDDQAVAIRAIALAIGIGFVGPRWIERLDVRQASLRAMGRAVRSVVRAIGPCLVLVDGRDSVPGLECVQRAVIGGDGRSLAIAAASVIAKTVRDRLMHRLALAYPLYGFDRHVGYGTPEHLEALHRYGPCPSHRRTFHPVAQLRFDFASSTPQG